MDIQGMRDYVRTYLDVDIEELPDLIVDQFLDDAYQKIIRRDRKWPWLQKAWSFTTTADLGVYTLAQIGEDIDDVKAVMIDGMPLPWSGQDDSEAQFAYGGSTENTGSPYQWSWWNSELYLWPVPDTAVIVSIRGYRVPIVYNGALPGSVPDIPLEFHSLMLRYALSCAYAQQDDPEMAAFNKQMFEDELSTKWHAYTQIPSNTPLVLNSRYSGALSPTGRLRFPFD